MKTYTEEIENKIVDQTVISEKGVGFDKLTTGYILNFKNA